MKIGQGRSILNLQNQNLLKPFNFNNLSLKDKSGSSFLIKIIKMGTDSCIYEEGNELISLAVETYGNFINCPNRSICLEVGEFYKCYSERVKQSEHILKITNQTN